MENTQTVVFSNLRDVRTGKPVEMKVPNSVYTGNHLAFLGARYLGQQMAKKTLALIGANAENRKPA